MVFNHIGSYRSDYEDDKIQGREYALLKPKDQFLVQAFGKEIPESGNKDNGNGWVDIGPEPDIFQAQVAAGAVRIKNPAPA